MEYRYRKEVLEELGRHEVSPTRSTPPELVREFINDRYLYEVRALKDRFKAGKLPKADYAKHVEAVRNRYSVLSSNSLLDNLTPESCHTRKSQNQHQQIERKVFNVLHSSNYRIDRVLEVTVNLKLMFASLPDAMFAF